MALIEKQQGRGANQSPSSYTRLFGLRSLGNLISRIHATTISSGTELQKEVWARVNQIQDLDAFLDSTLQGGDDKVFVCTKEQIKKSKKISSRYEPDFLGFNPHQRKLYIIELKDGDQFDTKKASGEHTTLHNFRNDISSSLPYSTEIYMCGFNARTRQELYAGLKSKFSMDEILTGKELSILFNFDYDEIVKLRTADEQTNLEYFVKEILRIPEIKNMLVGLFKNSKD